MYVYDEANNLTKQKGISLIILIIIVLIIVFITALMTIHFIDIKNANKKDVKIVETSSEINIKKEDVFTNSIENNKLTNNKNEIQTSYKILPLMSDSKLYEKENYITYDITEYNQFLSEITEANKENEDLDKYDETYFKDNALAIIFVTMPNPAYNVKVKNMEIKDNELFVNYYLEPIKEMTTMDVLCGETILVEVNKNVKKINAKKMEME